MFGVAESAIKGEKGTGFEKRGTKGPFECGNCDYFENGLCHQKDMMRMSKQPKRNGYPEVGKNDCCEYIERKGS